jgi:F-type H+-transporting ATPase subunit a
MGSSALHPDQPLWQWGPVLLNATILWTWVVMALLTVLSWMVTRRRFDPRHPSRRQVVLEVIVTALRNQIRDISRQEPGPYLPFIGTLFLLIAVANLLSIVPGYVSPTASLSTTAALATCVFAAVPLYGVRKLGVRRYLRQYLQPSVFMLPFNVIGELSRTLALAVRLYGNMMSGAMIGAMLLAFAPLFVPVVMQLFGLLTGTIQAWIFAILAMVYIASSTQVHEAREVPS